MIRRIVRLAFSAFERGEFAGPFRLFYSPWIAFHCGGSGTGRRGASERARTEITTYTAIRVVDGLAV